jgi:hypothetical protein
VEPEIEQQARHISQREGGPAAGLRRAAQLAQGLAEAVHVEGLSGA